MRTIRNVLSRGLRTSVICVGGRTKQAQRDECDINKLMAKYVKTGTINHVTKYGASYGDFSPVTLQEALNLQIDAQAMFDELPAVVRKRFRNDAFQFLEFVQDRSNLDEMRSLGLALPAAPVASTPVDAKGTQPSPATSPESGPAS